MTIKEYMPSTDKLSYATALQATENTVIIKKAGKFLHRHQVNELSRLQTVLLFIYHAVNLAQDSTKGREVTPAYRPEFGVIFGLVHVDKKKACKARLEIRWVA